MGAPTGHWFPDRIFLVKAGSVFREEVSATAGLFHGANAGLIVCFVWEACSNYRGLLQLFENNCVIMSVLRIKT